MKTDEKVTKAISRFSTIKKRNLNKYEKRTTTKNVMPTFTFKAPPDLMVRFAKVTKAQAYVSFSEHVRELIRYEVETFEEMNQHRTGFEIKDE